MPSVTLKGMSVQLHGLLKTRAADNKRSLNQEILGLLEKAVVPMQRLSVEELIEESRRVRESFSGLHMTDEEINAAKREGRP